MSSTTGERDATNAEDSSGHGDDLVRPQTHVQAYPEGRQSQRALEREQCSALASQDHICQHQSKRRSAESQQNLQDFAKPTDLSHSCEQLAHLQRGRAQASQENGVHI